MEALHENVLLVDAGDAISGAPVGLLSNGKYITELMNAVGYDAATIGNHEFDYGVDGLMLRADELNCGYICANFISTETGELVFEPYRIFEAGDRKIAFIGAATPETLCFTRPVYFQNDKGEFIYSFGEDGSIYGRLQKAVDDTRSEGADNVIILGHLGESSVTEGWSAQKIAAELTGIDVIIDGHSHEITPGMTVKSKDGKDIIVTQTGTKLNNIGKLTISPDGSVKSEIIDTVPEPDESMGLAEDSWCEDDAHPGIFVDEAVSLAILNIKEKLAGELGRKVGHTAFALEDSDPDTGIRVIRNMETNLGDLCADAFRYMLGADIGIVNAGGIRSSVRSGDITFNDILSVLPNGNSLLVAEITGQQLLDLLEMGTRNLPEESGALMQVSGVTYNIDESTESSVRVTERGEFISVDGEYRVSSVFVNGEPLDPEKTYTAAGSNYILKNGGDGYIVSGRCTILRDDVMPDTEALIKYIADVSGGEVPEKYSDPRGEGRITKGSVPAAPAGSLSLEAAADCAECHAGDEIGVTLVATNTGSGTLTGVVLYFEDIPAYTAETLEAGENIEIQFRLLATAEDIESGGDINVSADADGIAGPVTQTVTVRVLPEEGNPDTGAGAPGFTLVVFSAAAVLALRKHR